MRDEREREREARRFSNIHRELAKESQCALRFVVVVVVFDDIDVGDGVDPMLLGVGIGIGREGRRGGGRGDVRN